MALHLTEAEVRALFTPEVALASARRAFSALGNSQVTQPPRISTSIPAHDAVHLCMPCYLSDAEGEVLAMKAVTIFPHNREAFGIPPVLGFVVLYNPASGEPLAFIAAEHLTASRTAAGCALASTYLARPESSVLSVFGTGVQAAAHIEALLPLFALRLVNVFSPTMAAAVEFCTQMSEVHPIAFKTCTTVGEFLTGADIICCATNSPVPVFAAKDVPSGVHINAIGSHQPNTAELDSATVSAARVFVDSREAAQLGAGELIQAAEAGAWKWADLGGELSDLVLGRATRRESQTEITVFKSVGLATQDATAAHAVYQRTAKA